MHWKIIEKIASGTFGVVYKVRHQKTGKIAAMKLIHPRFQKSQERRRFKRAYVEASQVKHPNCVEMIQWIDKFSSIGYKNNMDSYGFVMELVEGNHISILKKAPIPQILAVLIQACNGLEALHSHHIIHRDLKPINILITSNGQVKITDFDLVKIHEGTNDLTATGVFMGTANYASPEQCNNTTNIDTRSDLYSLGVIFYELVTGKKPFSGQNFVEIAMGHIQSPLISPKQFVPDLPDQVEEIITKLLEKNPRDRIQTAKGVALHMNEALGGKDIIHFELDNYLSPPAFVGRTEIMEQLDCAFMDSLKGKGKAIFITGECGIGKTKLWEEFRIGLGLMNARILEAQCDQTGAIFQPLQDILLQALDSIMNISDTEKVRLLGRFAWDLTLIVPQLGEFSFMKEVKKLSLLSGKALETRLFEAITTFLMNLASTSSPTILFFDDLQWADEMVILWLMHFIRNIKNSPFFIVGTYRSEQVSNSNLGKLLPIMKQEELVEFIPVEPLNFEAVLGLMNSMLGKNDYTHKNFVENIFQQTGGNPLFIKEIMYHLFETKRLLHTDKNWTLAIETPSDLTLPETVKKTIVERLKYLHPDTVRLLSAAAVIGRTFGLDILMDMIEEDSESELMQGLEEARLINLIENIKDCAEYQFVHATVRETLLQSLNKSEKKNYHRLVGEKIEQFYEIGDNLHEIEPSVIENLADHFYAGDDVEKALKYCRYAGYLTKERYANRKALIYYSWAIDLLQRKGDKLGEIQCLRKKAQLLYLIGEWDEFRQVCQDNIQLAEDLGDETHIAITANALGFCLRLRGDYDSAMMYSKKALKIGEKLNDNIAIIYASNNIGIICGQRGEPNSSIKYFKKALKIAKKLEDKRNIPPVWRNLGGIYGGIGKHDLALNYFEKQLKVCKDVEDKVSASRIMGCIGDFHRDRGKYDKAMTFYQEGLEIANEVGDKCGVATIIKGIGCISVLKGDFESAMNYLKKALKMTMNMGNKEIISKILVDFAMMHRNKGEYSLAIDHNLEALKIAKEVGDQRTIIAILSSMGYIYYDKKDYDTALIYLDKAILLGKKIGLKSHMRRALIGKAEILFIQQQFKEAKLLCEEGLEIVRTTGNKQEIFRHEILLIKTEFELAESFEEKIQNGINPLQEILTKTKLLVEISRLNYELYIMNAKLGYREYAEVYRQRSLETYEDVYDKNPKTEYLNRIMELQSMEAKRAKDITYNSKLLISLLRFMSPETAFSELLNFLTEQCHADACQIIIQNKQSRKIEVRAVSSKLKDEDLDFSQTILMEVIKKNKPVCIPNAVEALQYKGNASILGKQFLSVIAVPLRTDITEVADTNFERLNEIIASQGSSQVIGALYLDRREVKHGIFNDDELHQVQFMANILAPILIRQDEMEQIKLQSEIRNLGMFIGNSKKMQQTYTDILEIAKVDFTVFIHGETGTGKELIARSLHQLSSQKEKAFVPVNCAAIPKELSESELFGHERGAFTGATFKKKGKFELADGGTLFLDEIGELDMDVQAKLLRAIEQKEIWPVGAQQPVWVKPRIVVATHKNLVEEIKKGFFREDLYHRLDVVKISVPPLRQRREDIPLLAYHFLQKYSREINKPISGFTSRALEMMQLHEWKGNVRELENTIAKAIFRHKEGDLLCENTLFPSQKYSPQYVHSVTHIPNEEHIEFMNKVLEYPKLNQKLDVLEEYAVTKALRRNKGNLTHTCKELSIDYKRLRRLLDKYGIRYEAD